MVFWYWSNIVLSNLDKNFDTFENHDLVCRILLWITEFYMIVLEISAISKRGKEYFNDISRLVNIVTPIMILINASDTDARD